jgi:predicted aldo/keto reductase-like oxidoreductase
MLYRTMKSTGDKLSILGFGCMRLPMKKGKIDEERAKRQIRYAIDRGVNYVDTAFTYHGGASEPFLGRALADGYRERIKLATKLPHHLVKNGRDMDGILKIQLNNLKTNFIDYYLVHNLNGAGWTAVKEKGIFDFLHRAKKGHRVVNTGFSFHGSRSDFKTIQFFR